MARCVGIIEYVKLCICTAVKQISLFTLLAVNLKNHYNCYATKINVAIVQKWIK